VGSSMDFWPGVVLRQAQHGRETTLGPSGGVAAAGNRGRGEVAAAGNRGCGERRGGDGTPVCRILRRPARDCSGAGFPPFPPRRRLPPRAPIRPCPHPSHRLVLVVQAPPPARRAGLTRVGRRPARHRPRRRRATASSGSCGDPRTSRHSPAGARAELGLICRQRPGKERSEGGKRWKQRKSSGGVC
jgi:hypothetical protein